MRGRSCSKQGWRGGGGGGGSMEIDKVCKFKSKEEQPHLSGAYIRSLVKHLTSSNTKDHPLDGGDGDGDGDGLLQKKLSKNKECFTSENTQLPQQQPPIQPPQHKKQVRRRRHTSRPYQERLLNMAEARREIVTALKFHRASMKQRHHPQPVQTPPPPPSEGKSKSRRNYASTAAAANNTYLEAYSTHSCRPPIPYFWPLPAIATPPPLIPENLNMTPPNQPLGLNLNFQDFNNLDTNLYYNPYSIYSSSSSSSPSTSSSPALSEAVPMSGEAVANSYSGGGGLHQAIGDEEIEEIRSIGEQHQMEWNDTLNLVTSARWFKFLKSVEFGPEEQKKAAHEEDDDHPFDQVVEFPTWLINANESFCLQQHLDDHFSDEYLHGPALPCMDIGEIEGMDGDWLA